MDTSHTIALAGFTHKTSPLPLPLITPHTDLHFAEPPVILVSHQELLFIDSGNHSEPHRVSALNEPVQNLCTKTIKSAILPKPILKATAGVKYPTRARTPADAQWPARSKIPTCAKTPQSTDSDTMDEDGNTEKDTEDEVDEDEVDDLIGECKEGKEGLIPKPPGENGRPGRGGYNVQHAAKWDDATYEQIKVSHNYSIGEMLFTVSRNVSKSW